MLKVDEKNGITLTRGDSAVFSVTVEDEHGETYDYSDDTVKFGVKRSAFDTDCVLEKTVEDGQVVLTPEDTENMEYGDYLYDIEITHVDDSGEEPVTDVWTPIAAARFTLGFNVL